MDKSQLVTIAVTVIITAFVKEMVGWLFSRAKKLAINATVRAKIKRAFTINRVIAIVNLILIVFCCERVYHHVNSSAPLDRISVFTIAIYTTSAVANLLRLEIQMAISTERSTQENVRALRDLERAKDELKAAQERHAALQPVFEEVRKIRSVVSEAHKAIKGEDEPNQAE
jgi:hypothetical protein